MTGDRSKEAHVSDGWRDPSRVSEYLAREIPNRDIAEAILLQALPARVERSLILARATVA
jgi:hypothetical protein